MSTTSTHDAHRAIQVGAAVLTWRGYEVTRACLDSLTRSAMWPFPVSVIDNGSETGEGVRLATEFGPPVEHLELERNLGVPGGYNAAIEWAGRTGLTHVLLLNNDTICTDPRMLARLCAAASPGVAVVGPLVERPDGSLQSGGGVIRWRTGRAPALRRGQLPRLDGPYEVEWVDGSCMLVSVEAARVIGGLADDFFMYWEEVDWGTRARRARYRCVVEPRTSITHIGSASIRPGDQLRRWMRNRLLFMRRNAGRLDNVTSLLAFITMTVPNHLVRQGARPSRWLAVLRAAGDAIRWNVGDAIRRRAWLVKATGRTGGPP